MFPLTVMTPRGPGILNLRYAVWYRIESSECGSSEQCVVTTVERDDIED